MADCENKSSMYNTLEAFKRPALAIPLNLWMGTPRCIFQNLSQPTVHVIFSLFVTPPWPARTLATSRDSFLGRVGLRTHLVADISGDLISALSCAASWRASLQATNGLQTLWSAWPLAMPPLKAPWDTPLSAFKLPLVAWHDLCLQVFSPEAEHPRLKNPPKNPLKNRCRGSVSAGCLLAETFLEIHT